MSPEHRHYRRARPLMPQLHKGREEAITATWGFANSQESNGKTGRRVKFNQRQPEGKTKSEERPYAISETNTTKNHCGSKFWLLTSNTENENEKIPKIISNVADMIDLQIRLYFKTYLKQRIVSMAISRKENMLT